MARERRDGVPGTIRAGVRLNPPKTTVAKSNPQAAAA